MVSAPTTICGGEPFLGGCSLFFSSHLFSIPNPIVENWADFGFYPNVPAMRGVVRIYTHKGIQCEETMNPVRPVQATSPGYIGTVLSLNKI